MTPLPALVDTNGRPIPLDRQLASGGEGAVYTIPNDPTVVAKLYHRPPSAQTIEKLAAMVRLANTTAHVGSFWSPRPRLRGRGLG